MLEVYLKHLFPVILSLAGSAFITWFSIPLVVKVTSLKHLTDVPAKRKVHKHEIPTLGGVAIFAGFSTGFLMSINGYMEGVTYFTVAILLLFFVGIKDDLITLDPRKRLIAEIMAAVCLIYFTDIRITDFHGFLGITTIPVWATYFTTICLMIIIINAVNLIDGIDGLAATSSIIATGTFGYWFLLSGNENYTIMAASLMGALIGFLRFNLSTGKNKIFMGDTGSLIIGFLLAAMCIRFNETNAGASTWHDLDSAPAISIAILIVPLFDTLRVFTVRLFYHQHPFTADNRHIHHLLLRAGFSHRRATFLMCMAQLYIISLAFYIDHLGIIWISVILLAKCILLTGLIYVMIYRNCLINTFPVRKEDTNMIRLILIVHRVFRPKRKREEVRAGVRGEE